MKDRYYSKELVVPRVPTLEELEKVYKAYEPENVKDAVITSLLHYYAKKKLKSGFIDRPGTYKITLRIKMPIMFWHRLYYSIERL